MCLYILNVFSIYLYSILFHHDKANKLVIAKIVLSLCMKKEVIKKIYPGYSTVPDSKISNLMEKTLIFQVKYKSIKNNE